MSKYLAIWIKRFLCNIDSSLLLEKLDEKDFVIAPTGHKFNLKPYQAALAVDDMEMARRIQDYFFLKLANKEEADNQYEEQCYPPKEMLEIEEKKWTRISNQLDNLANVILDRKEDIISRPDYVPTVKKGSIVETELIRFWGLLGATRDDIITAGKRPFDANLLLKALQILSVRFTFKDDLDPRTLLFWQKVIGYEGIQRFMPVNYVQAYRGGLTITAEKLRNDRLQNRDTCFNIIRDINLLASSLDFYPLQDRGVVGFNFGLWSCGGLGLGGCVALAGRENLEKLMSIKNKKLAELMPRREYRT